MSGWGAEIGRLLALSLVGAVCGALLGAPMAGAFFGLLGHNLWRMSELRRFDDWLSHSIGHPPPLGATLEDIAYRLWRQRRAGRARTRRLTRMLRQLQRATNALPDAAVLLDGRDGIVWFNEAGTRLLGLRRGDVHHSLSVLLRAPEIHALLANDADAESVEMASPADEKRLLEVRLISYTEDRRLLLARDVTQIAELRTMRQDFIANVSHELRTPLTVVIGYLEALDEEADAELIRRTLMRLQRPTARMKTLVEDLLLLSRLDTSVAPPRGVQGRIDVSALARRICTDASALGETDHRFCLDLDEHLLLQGIDTEIHSALGNLVVNAVRYSPDGGEIRVRWAAEGDGARFSVSDQGIGIRPEHIPRLTERFYRVDVGRSRDAGGTGLGLAIVKHVLRRHESELEVTSTPGAGSTFSCRFPAGRVIDRREEAARTSLT